MKPATIKLHVEDTSVAENKPMTWLQKIPRSCLYLLVFLIPLWFLPITQDALNFQKQALLVVLVLLATVSWLAIVVNKRELSFRLNWLHLAVVALVSITLISAATSIWRYGSFWGWPLSIPNSFLTIFFFALLYFLISNSVKDEQELFQLFFTLIAATVLAGIYTVLQLYKVFVIPFSFAKATTFNTIGSANSVSILSAVLLPLSLTLSSSLKSFWRWWCWVFTVLLLAVVLLINFFNAWVVLATGLLVVLVFGMWNVRKRIAFGWIAFSMALLVVALIFLIFKISLPGAPASPLEVFPSRSAEFSIFSHVQKQNPLFGTGPGTFALDYAKYHQPSLNQTIFWGTRFSSGASELFDWFITQGLLGGVVLLVLIIMAAIVSVRTLVVLQNDSFSWILLLSILASFAAICVTQAMYYSNFTMSFVFWVLLAGLGWLTANQQKKISIAPPSWLAIIFSFTFLLVVIFSVGLVFVISQKYVAEVQYLQGVQTVSANGDVNKGITNILSSVALNPSVDLYWRDLAQLYLSQLNQILANKNLSDAEKKQQSQTAVTNAIVAANRAVVVAPQNVENWNVRGFVYRNLIGIQDADALAVESYQKAMALEPSSPFSVTELGRVYFVEAQNLANQKDTTGKEQDMINKALDTLNKAVALKPDYAPANYLIALIYGQEGKSDEEIARLEKTKTIAPNDIGLAFQLGVLYYQKNQLDKAQSELERAKSLDPNYANARYILGLVYDKQGEKNKAIEEFKKVLALNPDNDQVKKILDNLNSGKPALTGIQPSQPPVPENPPEINNKEKKK